MSDEEDVDLAYFRASRARHEEREAALRDAVEWKRRALDAEAKIAKAEEAYKAGPLAFHEGFKIALAMHEILTDTERKSRPSTVNLEALRRMKDHERNGGEF